jgi:hypothetical protein
MSTNAFKKHLGRHSGVFRSLIMKASPFSLLEIKLDILLSVIYIIKPKYGRHYSSGLFYTLLQDGLN